jgi:signal transduction histidine kinase
MNYKSLLTTLLFLVSVGIAADEPKDTAFANLYRRYFQLYSDSNETAFYQATEQLKDYYLQHDNKDSYYKVYLNELLYDTEHGKTYRAIKKANMMLHDMEEQGDKHYDIVYSALGNIYDLRGNYRMANKYYKDALKACAPNDTGALVGIYSRIASLQAHREPQKAMEVNEHFGSMTANNPQYHKVYVVQKGEISFYLRDKRLFEKTYEEYLQICEKYPLLDGYGADMMKMLKAAFTGDYATALETLEHSSTDFDALDRCDMRILIYEMMGNRQQALKEVEYRRDLRDSLNSDMLFESINEINSEMGMNRVQEQARQDREQASRRQKMLMAGVIALLLAALGLIASRYLVRRRYQKQLLAQNRELEIALSRAEESDRMKSSFIEHVSHEIRTPLNVITGFAQVITNPVYQLSEQDRNTMLDDISKNTAEITNIVNELLEIAEDESKEHYTTDEDVNVKQLCDDLMLRMEVINNGRLQLQYKHLVDDNLVIHSNRQAIDKILSQLLKNAIKFTQQGTVELKVRERAANGGIEFAITDTGIGIDEQYHQKVFERFYKVDTFKQGLGLGLTMSRKIAKLIDATLEIDPSYKKGSRFLLIVPHHNYSST